MAIIETPHDIQESFKQAGLWEAFSFNVKASLEELKQRLFKANREARKLPEWELWDYIAQFGVPGVQMTKQAEVWNKITNGFLQDSVGARLVNAHTANESGIVYYLGVGTNNTDASSTQTQLQLETFRKTPLTKTSTGSQQKFILFLDFAEANPATATTIAAGGPYSTTVFDVDSVTGFAVGDAIRVGTAVISETRITDITSNTITIDATEPLTAAPTAGQTVDLMLGEAGTFGNEAASPTANTGTLFSRSRLRVYKSTDFAYFIKKTFIGQAT